jgi:hypothetical protein
MAYTSDQYYVEPWSAWDLNLREFYVPTLIMEFMERSYLSQMVPLKVDLGAVSTKKMIWTGIYPLEPSWNAIDDVGWWVDRMYPAGYRIEVGMETYGSGMGLGREGRPLTKAAGQQLSVMVGKVQAWITRAKQAVEAVQVQRLSPRAPSPAMAW